MINNNNIYIWESLCVLFTVCALFLAGLKIRDLLHQHYDAVVVETHDAVVETDFSEVDCSGWGLK